MVKFWRPVEKVGRRFSFINFWFSKIRRVSRIRGRTLISHQLQSFEARKKSFWIWVPYICIIDCVKKNWAETLQSWFSIGGVESTPPPWEPRKKYAVGNRVKQEKNSRIFPRKIIQYTHRFIMHPNLNKQGLFRTLKIFWILLLP